MQIWLKDLIAQNQDSIYKVLFNKAFETCHCLAFELLISSWK